MALLLAGGASSPRYMETVVQDDAQLLHRPAAAVQASMRQIADLGATRVRLTASWSSLAPSPHAKHVPGAPFNASDPASYPGDAFKGLDTAVKAASSAGLATMVDIAFWAPRWAVGRPAANHSRERYFVDADAFADFARSVARRYSGTFTDPADRRHKLPAVRLFTTWNEPNHPSFLQPQWVRDANGGFRPESPHIYRAMHNAAYDAIKSVSRDDMVLVGGTASTGSTVAGTGGVPPLQFLRTMACVDDQLQPLGVPECASFTPIKADGYANHPYSRYTSPGQIDPVLDDAPIADVDRLDDLLSKLYANGRVAQRLALYDTEYGYETNEDDPYQPFDRDQQAAFMGWSDYLAYRQPDTRMFAQFLLRDVDPAESGHTHGTRQYYRDFQTGLYTADGNAKPAARAFKLPLWAQTQGIGPAKAVLLFGQVRPGSGTRSVRVDRQDPASGVWRATRTFGPTCDTQDGQFLTDKAGFFTRYGPALGPSNYRLAWQHDNGTWEYGVPVAVADEASAPPPMAAATGPLR